MFDFLLLINFITSWRFWLRGIPAVILAGLVNEYGQGLLGRTGTIIVTALIIVGGAVLGVMAEQAAEERGDGILPRKSRKRSRQEDNQ